MDLVIDRATILEWPQIVSLKEEYLSRFPPMPWEKVSHDDAIWWVVRSGERVLGATAWDDRGEVRWVTDFYVLKGLAKILAVKVAVMLRDCIERQAYESKRSIAFMTQYHNQAQMRSNLRRTKAKPVTVIFYKEYKEVRS